MRDIEGIRIIRNDGAADQIRAATKGVPAGAAIRVELVCECGAPPCTERFEVPLSEYEARRTRPVTFEASSHAEDGDTQDGAQAYMDGDRSAAVHHYTRLLTSALHELLERGASETNSHVVLQGDPGRNYYIQYAVQGTKLFVEAVHNKHLREENALSPGQEALLQELGWSAPETEQQNWFQEMPVETADPAQVAALSMDALIDVYGVRRGRPVHIQRSMGADLTLRAPKIRSGTLEHLPAPQVKPSSLISALDALGLEPRERGPLVDYRLHDGHYEVEGSVGLTESTIHVWALLATPASPTIVLRMLHMITEAVELPYSLGLMRSEEGTLAPVLHVRIPVEGTSVAQDWLKPRLHEGMWTLFAAHKNCSSVQIGMEGEAQEASSRGRRNDAASG